MSITEVAEPAADQEVADFVGGLRAAADWFEQHPDYCPSYQTIPFDLFVLDKAALAKAAKTLGSAVKGEAAGYFYLRKSFGPSCRLDVNVARERVCLKIVTGTRKVPEQIIEAHTEEIIEWECDDPILKAVPA